MCTTSRAGLGLPALEALAESDHEVGLARIAQRAHLAHVQRVIRREIRVEIVLGVRDGDRQLFRKGQQIRGRSVLKHLRSDDEHRVFRFDQPPGGLLDRIGGGAELVARLRQVDLVDTLAHALARLRRSPHHRDRSARRPIRKPDRPARDLRHLVGEQVGRPQRKGLGGPERVVPALESILPLCRQISVRVRHEERDAVLPGAVQVADGVADACAAAEKEPEAAARHRVARRRSHRVPLVGDVDHLHVAGGVDRLPERAEPAGVRMKEHPDAGRAELCEDGPRRRAVVHLERVAARQRVGHETLRGGAPRGRRSGGLLGERGNRRTRPERDACHRRGGKKVPPRDRRILGGRLRVGVRGRNVRCRLLRGAHMASCFW